MDETRAAVSSLRPGDVVHIPRTRRRGLAVVVASRDGKPTVLSEDRSFFRVSAKDFDEPPAVLTRISLPRTGSARSARFRRDVASTLVALQVTPPRRATARAADPKVERQAARLESAARAHPCASCPERAKHERWAERATKLEQQISGIDRRIRVRTETLARRFDRVLAVLADLGYVEEWSLTPKGRTLTRIYGEGDVLVGEALATDLFDGLEPPDLAALVSTVVYEARERNPLPGALPTPEAALRYERLQRLWRRIRRTEDEHQVQLCRELEPGFATPIHRWCAGVALEEILEETEMAPGDFVRNCKQLLDLLRQIAEVAEPGTAASIRAAHDAVLHGVVAYTGV
jgi:ATP-dependent RNA helicase HelY